MMSPIAHVSFQRHGEIGADLNIGENYQKRPVFDIVNEIRAINELSCVFCRELFHTPDKPMDSMRLIKSLDFSSLRIPIAASP